MIKQYKIEEDKQVIWYEENGFRISFPIDESNSDYQAYLRWVENPNAPEFQTPWVEPQLTK